jgi:uncharacterized protein (TIGR03435 family)
MAQVAESLPGPGSLGRPVVDETGLVGTYDFFLNFALENVTPPNPFSPEFAITQDSDSAGPSFLEAVKDQLGMKLVPKELPLQVLVIDHVEQPSPNQKPLSGGGEQNWISGELPAIRRAPG